MSLTQQTDLILLDFNKAFDKVNHLNLLYKLQMHGKQGKSLKWILSFLVGRSQCGIQRMGHGVQPKVHVKNPWLVSSYTH